MNILGLMSSTYRGRFFAPDGEGAGGGSAAAAGASAPAAGAAAAAAAGGGDAAGAAAAAAAGAGDAPKPAPSVLGDLPAAKVDDAAAVAAAAAAAAAAAQTPEQKALAAARERNDVLAKETPEAKAIREKAETPEQKTAREADAALVKNADEAAKVEREKPYEALKLPEGMPRDQPAFKDFIATAAELGLPIEQGQKLIDAIAPKLKEAIDAPYEMWATMLGQWVKSAESDAEYGGANYKANLGICAQALDAYGNGVEVRKALAFTGAGNHPEIIRWMYRAGLKQSEGGPANGRNANTSDKTLAERVYPEMGQAPA